MCAVGPYLVLSTMVSRNNNVWSYSLLWSSVICIIREAIVIHGNQKLRGPQKHASPQVQAPLFGYDYILLLVCITVCPREYCKMYILGNNNKKHVLLYT